MVGRAANFALTIAGLAVLLTFSNCDKATASCILSHSSFPDDAKNKSADEFGTVGDTSPGVSTRPQAGDSRFPPPNECEDLPFGGHVFSIFFGFLGNGRLSSTSGMGSTNNSRNPSGAGQPMFAPIRDCRVAPSRGIRITVTDTMLPPPLISSLFRPPRLELSYCDYTANRFPGMRIDEIAQALRKSNGGSGM
jgi:hypothetical protein